MPVEMVAPAGRAPDTDFALMQELMRSYQTTLHLARHPLREFSYVHMARKVVGVGSVGTRAWIILLRGRDDGDLLLLQAKQAEQSVLERFLPPSEFVEHGQRVVMGQRHMQAASDIFLGWQRVKGYDDVERDFYLRQLHDWKGSVDVEVMEPPGANSMPNCAAARLRGRTPARAIASPSRPTSAAATGSIARSPSSPPTTPTRTIVITRRSPKRSRRAVSRRPSRCERDGCPDGGSGTWHGW